MATPWISHLAEQERRALQVGEASTVGQSRPGAPSPSLAGGQQGHPGASLRVGGVPPEKGSWRPRGRARTGGWGPPQALGSSWPEALILACDSP